MTSLPTLVVVSGPIGSGKTTLAHKIARAVGCPVVSRDEIKEGLAHGSPEFRPAPVPGTRIPPVPACRARDPGHPAIKPEPGRQAHVACM